MKSECEKAIEEVIAQIRNKFEAKLHDAEIAFHLKKNELDKNHNNVLMNRILAEAFRSKCLDLKPSSPSRLQQGNNSLVILIKSLVIFSCFRMSVPEMIL